MAVLHRALFTWFNLLIFLILLVLRLDHRIQWNWFIVFIPMWLYDNILLVYIAFHMILSCKNTHERAVSIRRTVSRCARWPLFIFHFFFLRFAKQNLSAISRYDVPMYIDILCL
ncbi:unnamed protein product [Trichogramma brassicae]|uniref:Transmembrane protein 60 n=1 Tax=Trichogramma brassicae TaxID=86971 RepID=A0A6H5IPY7_9HYME|nr:unnamed protein product [Trichogramma brassicae]